MKVKTIMRTDISTVADDWPLSRARSLLAREPTGLLPVVRGDRLVGILTARDAERAGLDTVWTLASYDPVPAAERLTVRGVMTAEFATLRSESTVAEAASVLARVGFDALPVLDGRALVGMVGTRELLAVLTGLFARRPDGHFEHLLVPVDFGPATAATVETARKLALHHGARLTLLHVVPPSSRLLLVDGVPEEIVERLDLRHREECLLRLSALAPQENGLDVAQLVVTGDPPAQIVAAAAGLGVDLIVVGRSGRAPGWFRPADLAETLVGGAPCPVLAVRLARAPEAVER